MSSAELDQLVLGTKGSLWNWWKAELISLDEEVGREKARLGRRRREVTIMVLV